MAVGERPWLGRLLVGRVYGRLKPASPTLSPAARIRWSVTGVPGLEEEVEIEAVAAVVVAEEDSVLRVGDVVVDREGVEVVGQIETRHGEPHGVFRSQLEIAGEAGVGGEEMREACRVAIGDAEIILELIVAGVRESVTIFHDGVHGEA